VFRGCAVAHRVSSLCKNEPTEPGEVVYSWENRSREFLAFTPTPVPEPTSLLLVGSCLTVLTGVAWRQLRRK